MLLSDGYLLYMYAMILYSLVSFDMYIMILYSLVSFVSSLYLMLSSCMDWEK